MSEPHRPLPPPRRESSDFSIERILSKNVSSSASSASSVTTGVVDKPLGVPEQTCASFLCSPSTLVNHSNLDWLRNFCKLQSTKATIEMHKADSDALLVNRNNSVQQSSHSKSECFNSEELSWLRCTRYRPPKLPRKSCAGKTLKRKLGSHPRIPFTKYQLEILEDKYKTSAYLSRKDVLHLSDLLHLPQNRIKIWFQNRRARERREIKTLQRTEITRISL